ncbi:hypothetical protein KBB27_01860 [Patescibacteria group bacterium]|nr:hypothetical protein [Patescibacteria group bacterium]
MTLPLVRLAALHAGGTLLYIALVSSILFNAPRIFGTTGEDIVLIPIAMLLLFVFSAALTGSLILGRPVLWYLDGKKKEAIILFIMTLGFLFLATLFAFLALIFFTRS